MTVESTLTPKQRYQRAQTLAEQLGVSRNTIWRWSKEGNFPKPYKLGNGTTVWDKLEVDAWIASKAA